jgi:hypothetical protein
MAALAALLLVVPACSEGRRAPQADPPKVSTKPNAYPYTTPTPPAEPTTLDGLYVREVPEDVVGGAGKCRRCPPYRLAPGRDVLELDRGVFRVSHQGIGYMAVGHYTVEGGRITFFNDPNCSSERGTYAWRLEDGLLQLEVVEDECAFGDVRVRFMTAAPWTRS